MLFARNVAEPAQVADLAREAAELSRTAPVWVAIDQEGGRVQRVKAPLTVWPPPPRSGAPTISISRAALARALARELRAMGITFDFAPVLDVLTRKDNPAIGDRALSDDPERVARHGVALIRGAAGRKGCRPARSISPDMERLPVDSHEDLPVVDLSPDRLERVEWVPFKAAIDAGVDAVMSCHLLVPSLDEQSPATLSPEVITGPPAWSARDSAGSSSPTTWT